MKHYTNKKTLETFGYESDEEAKELNKDYDNLVLMSDELFQEYREQKAGHKWSLSGWVEDEELMSEIKERERLKKISDIESEIQKLEQDLIVANLRGKDISDILKDLEEVEKELASLN